MEDRLEEATFEDLYEFPHIFRLYFNREKKSFDKEERPALLTSDSLYWDKYTPVKKAERHSEMLSARTTTPHGYFPPLRGVITCPYAF